MPWCPKCKNEYKEGIKVCADCGCQLFDTLGAEMVAFFGPEDEADKLLDYIEENGFDFAYKQYNSKEGRYEIIVQESKVNDLRPSMKLYYDKIRAAENEKMQNFDEMYENVEADEPLTLKRYKKPAERAVEYKAGAATLLFLGVLGIITLILIDLQIIPLYFTMDRKILINVVLGGTFVLFVGLGINSYMTYKKLIDQVKVDDELEQKITDWFNTNVNVDDITNKENPEESEEILYFNRFKNIKSKINGQFDDLDQAFVEYLADILYNDLFK